MTIEEAWAALNPKPGRTYRTGKFTSDAELARALALASFRVGWEAGCGWDDDPDAENSEVDIDTLLVGEARIAALP